MSVIEVVGDTKLNGEVKVFGAKNSILPLLAACILCEEEVVLQNCSLLKDVHNTIAILNELGAKVKIEGRNIIVNAKELSISVLPKEMSKKMRSSIFFLGPLIARMKKARAYFPGGCDIGLRPIDLHLKALREMKVSIQEDSGIIDCDAGGLTGAEIVLDYPSVGATENILMAATLAKGRTVIHNAAREPEIVDLQNFLNAMGAKVSGAGSTVIYIDGVKKLTACKFSVISDRIVAGTYMIASALSGGDVLINNIVPSHLQCVIAKLRETGTKVYEGKESLRIKSTGKLKEISTISTAPYPGFPTDMQSQFLVLCTLCRGTGVIVENVFENRFQLALELKKMGANIIVNDRTAIIKGVKSLKGALVSAGDLRGGASLVLAGLGASGITTIENIHHIERGYEDICRDLKLIGAKIKMCDGGNCASKI